MSRAEQEYQHSVAHSHGMLRGYQDRERKALLALVAAAVLLILCSLAAGMAKPPFDTPPPPVLTAPAIPAP